MTKPVLIEHKGKRFLQYNNRRYKIVSDESTHQILKDIDRILETILKDRSKRKRVKKRKKTQKNFIKTTNIPPEVFASSKAAELKQEKEKTFNLQRELLKLQEKPPPLPKTSSPTVVPIQKTIPPGPSTPKKIKDDPRVEEKIDVTLESGRTIPTPKIVVDEGSKKIKTLSDVAEKQDAAIKHAIDVIEKKDDETKALKSNLLKAHLNSKQVTGEKLKQIASELNIRSMTQPLKKDKVDYLMSQKSDKEIEDAMKKLEIPIQSGSGDLKTFKKKGMLNVEINKLLKDIPPYIGCFSFDQLMNLQKPKSNHFCFVYNTEPLGHDGHWISSYITPKTIEIFDAFGNEPQKGVIDKIFSLCSPGPYQVKINRVVHQDIKSSLCGLHACNFLIRRIVKNDTFKEATGYNHLKIDKSNHYEKKLVKDFENVKIN